MRSRNRTSHIIKTSGARVQFLLQKLDKATDSLEDTGPLSVLGTMLSSFF